MGDFPVNLKLLPETGNCSPFPGYSFQVITIAMHSGNKQEGIRNILITNPLCAVPVTLFKQSCNKFTWSAPVRGIIIFAPDPDFPEIFCSGIQLRPLIWYPGRFP